VIYNTQPGADHSGVGRLEFFAVFGLKTEEKKKVTSDR
jgi:hypothetical protein